LVIVVTGHSSGIGAALASALLERGLSVMGIARRSNAELVKRFPKTFKEERLDLADAAALERWLKRNALATFVRGQTSAMLVNNAGVLQPIGPLASQAVDAISRAVAVNVAAPLVLSAAFARATADSEDRRILHISSGAARNAYAGWAVYCATKAALDHHARAVALDRTPNLRICSLAPGVIDTNMQVEIRGSSEMMFPDRQRFVDLKNEGKLYDPQKRAVLLADYLLADSFGTKIVDELPRK